jgi:chromosome condensin MukBEF MukE localization factor
VTYLRTITALGLIGALALLVVGCGGGTDVDFTKASETVRASLESKREGFGAPVENVDCPKGVKVEPGLMFQCTVRYPDGKVAYALMKIRTDEADLNLESLSPHPFLRQVIH